MCRLHWLISSISRGPSRLSKTCKKLRMQQGARKASGFVHFICIFMQTHHMHTFGLGAFMRRYLMCHQLFSAYAFIIILCLHVTNPPSGKISDQ